LKWYKINSFQVCYWNHYYCVRHDETTIQPPDAFLPYYLCILHTMSLSVAGCALSPNAVLPIFFHCGCNHYPLSALN
jgi:hypothetical protein